jgi:protease IV
MSESDASGVSNEIIKSLIDDRRRDRRWRIIRFSIISLLIVGYVVLSWVQSRDQEIIPKHASYVALVRMTGVILPGTQLSANAMVPLLNEAYRDKSSKGVVLLINSPGGSAVQSSIIYDKIMQLKKKYHKKTVVVAEDSLASGAYLIASAADEIYVDPDTITGSIGVIMSGFGFTDAIKKLGITRRVFTAGVNKDRMDPFTPITSSDTVKMHQMLADAHQNFINDVKAGRKGRLSADTNTLFSGDFWSGDRAVQLGLVDGTGDLWSVMQKEFNVQYYKIYEPKKSLIQAMLSTTSAHVNIPGLHAEYGVLAQYNGVQ